VYVDIHVKPNAHINTFAFNFWRASVSLACSLIASTFASVQSIWRPISLCGRSGRQGQHEFGQGEGLETQGGFSRAQTADDVVTDNLKYFGICVVNPNRSFFI